ncbi:MAG: hypothetical protein P9L94_02625 [Candidatus Hinthialibacter antarcticus]|nr:hypothetical protein [Candidatus Hinthialibacter antarcticus]
MKLRTLALSAAMLFATSNGFTQEISFFFSAGDVSGEPDRFGNVHAIEPSDAYDPRPFGNEALADVFFDDDNLWLIYQVDGNTMLVSHGPGFFEDAPEIAMNITPALSGKYEVILNFLDNNGVPDTGPLLAALGDGEFTQYSAMNSERASGGTSPGYPAIDGTTQGGMFWYSASLGEVEVEQGEVITVRVDDVQGDVANLNAEFYVTSTFRGVTLRAIELGGTLSEIQVSPGALEFTSDVSGNQFRTGPADAAAYPNQEDWLTVQTREDGSGKWNIREGLGSYGPILESFPSNGNDGVPLRTSVIFAADGAYNVYLNMGDTAGSTPSQNCGEPNPILFGLEGGPLATYMPDEGTFKSTPGYNDYEIPVAVLSVEASEQVDFIIDDAIEYPDARRSVYMGLRLEKINPGAFPEIQISPGAAEWATDLSGNRYRTLPTDICLNTEDWLTVQDREDGSGKWNIREGLGPYGPILESFPENGNDALALRTSIIFTQAGTYDAFFNIGDTAASDEQQNIDEPNPILFGLEGGDLQTWHPNDGEFKTTPGYNDYEISLGEFTIGQGERLDFIIDDAIDYPDARRSVYLGMRFVLLTSVEAWSLY